MVRGHGNSVRFALLACLLSIWAGLGCSRGEQPSELLVFGAASLADVLTEIGEAREAEGGPRLHFNFAASSLLARQIDAGAPASVFVSASQAHVSFIESRGRIRAGVARSVATNQLVVVVPRAGTVVLAQAADLLNVRRLVLADPAGVPAGVHAKDWLEREGLWMRLQAKVIPALNVRAALAAVASGEVDAGIVYATDALTTDAVRVAFPVAGETAPHISYVAAPLLPMNGEALAYVEYLTSPRAQAVFSRHGFSSNRGRGPSR